MTTPMALGNRARGSEVLIQLGSKPRNAANILQNGIPVNTVTCDGDTINQKVLSRSQEVQHFSQTTYISRSRLVALSEIRHLKHNVRLGCPSLLPEEPGYCTRTRYAKIKPLSMKYSTSLPPEDNE